MANSFAFFSRYRVKATRHLTWPAACLLPLFIGTACDPVSFILVPTAGVVAAGADERGVKTVASDAGLRTKINYAWLANEPALLDRLTLSVIEGRVVLTGMVETAELKERALTLTRAVAGVKELKDHITVGKRESLADYTRDGWITTKLRTELLCDGAIASRNYSVRTVNRVIYLTGIAQNQQELNLVMTAAKNISGVRRVISYVRIKNPPARWDPSPHTTPNDDASMKG